MPNRQGVPPAKRCEMAGLSVAGTSPKPLARARHACIEAAGISLAAVDEPGEGRGAPADRCKTEGLSAWMGLLCSVAAGDTWRPADWGELEKTLRR
jgi:hypothetical protein